MVGLQHKGFPSADDRLCCSTPKPADGIGRPHHPRLDGSAGNLVTFTQPKVCNMRILMCLAALAVVGCAQEAAREPANPAEQYAGAWDGQSVPEGADSGVAWVLDMSVTAEGTLSGTLTFSGSETPVAVRPVEVTDSAVVLELGPYESPTVGAMVVTRSSGRVSGDSLWGNFEMLPAGEGGVVPDMSVAQWHNAVTNPAPGSEPILGTFTAKRRPATP